MKCFDCDGRDGDCDLCEGTGEVHCCFPDCGCDSARLCMFGEANEAAMALNREKQRLRLPSTSLPPPRPPDIRHLLRVVKP